MARIDYQPTLSRVLIKREIKERTSGGIIIPDAKRHARCQGEIIAIGPTAGWVEMPQHDGTTKNIREFDIGSKVIFGRHAGAWLDSTYGNAGEEKDDGTLFICDEKDILAVMKEVA